MADSPARSSVGDNDDIKAKMRAALDRKQGRDQGADEAGHRTGPPEKAHGPEVRGGATHKMHRRKAGGGGS